MKLRRLFFVFADRHKHVWRERLNPDDFNLGTGDRALITGGKIHPRYRIMVPPEFVDIPTGDADGP
ncbi:type IV toxin-antitoxin system AbiEi family antitoxin domain-containing protein [Ectothiorhodospira sp. BSL-9]|uniref:type IV toxin-antitoxin system AbiEi family antitoxin domain-containing protein n=1 Tax=Ectothiorhodospira sp. BSL-9 TaxID=1442136 RepID=UPI001F0A89D8|nr:type IV toxin-antitoxin system AbiEi family antitoxin domain-containing protein [Ectothiorhodospira sp. BSL-9]